MRGGLLHITQRHPGVQRSSDERVPQRMRCDDLADPGAAGSRADDPPGAMAVQPPPVCSQDQFITPAELRSALARHHLREDGLTGLKPGVSPPALIRLMRQLKKGRLSCGELGRRAAFVLTKDLRVSYIGHATKIASPEAATAK